ncbi:MAG: methyltransferase domain-containing protein [Sandaracinaceae bacterium]|nr:methyltransferase domain-containing protein [Sandaracinaceae bacterium]
MAMKGRESSPRMAAVSSANDAAVYDAHVVPRYSSLFGRMLLAHVPENERVQVLDVGCGTGHPALEILARLDPGGRVIAIDPDSALLDLARRRALDESGRRIFFKAASAEELDFGNEVFDVVTGNLAMSAWLAPEKALSELYRVLTERGLLLLTQALAGTFEEVFDMFRELALRRDDGALAARVERIALRYPSASTLEAVIANAGFASVRVKTEEFQLAFGSARDLLADPALRFVAVPEWRWIAGFEDDGLLEEMVRMLDTYFGGGPLSLRVHAGLAIARV